MDDLQDLAAHNQQRRDSARVQEKLESIEQRLSNQNFKDEHQSGMQSTLFNLSKRIDEELHFLTSEQSQDKLEKESKEIAFFHEKSMKFESTLTSPDNYSGLEYKELASKTRSQLVKLKATPWYEWAKSETELQVRDYLNAKELEKQRRLEAQHAATKAPVSDWKKNFKESMTMLIVIGVIGVILALFNTCA